MGEVAAGWAYWAKLVNSASVSKSFFLYPYIPKFSHKLIGFSYKRNFIKKQTSIKYEQTKIILMVSKINHLKEKLFTILTTNNLNALFLVDSFEVLQTYPLKRISSSRLRNF
jgi:hypothetical protein